MSADPHPSNETSRRARPLRPRRPWFLAVTALLVGTAIAANATDTPAIWAAPGAILIAGMWIAGRPRRRQIRVALSAAVLLTAAAAALISPAVLFVWPAAGLARLVQRRGVRGARVPLAVAAGGTALGVGAVQLGLPFGIAFLALVPLVVISRHHGHARCRAVA